MFPTSGQLSTLRKEVKEDVSNLVSQSKRRKSATDTSSGTPSLSLSLVLSQASPTMLLLLSSCLIKMETKKVRSHKLDDVLGIKSGRFT